MSPGAVDLVEEEAFDRFGRLISVEAFLKMFLPRISMERTVVNMMKFPGTFPGSSCS